MVETADELFRFQPLDGSWSWSWMLRPVLSPRMDGLGARRLDVEEEEDDDDEGEGAVEWLDEDEALGEEGEVTAIAGAGDRSKEGAGAMEA